MAKKRAIPKVAHERDDSAPDAITSNKLSRVFLRQAELSPPAEQDNRFVEFLTRGSIPELSTHLNKVKNEKFELLTLFPELQQFADVHPKRHKLANLNRRIRLCEKAILSLESPQPPMVGVKSSSAKHDDTAVGDESKRRAGLRSGAEPGERAQQEIEGTAQRRQAFVEPILRRKGWSRHDLAIHAAVDHHTINDYANGRTKPYSSTLKKIADALEVSPEALPD